MHRKKEQRVQRAVLPNHWTHTLLESGDGRASQLHVKHTKHRKDNLLHATNERVLRVKKSNLIEMQVKHFLKISSF